jgi:hypothetical protein
MVRPIVLAFSTGVLALCLGCGAPSSAPQPATTSSQPAPWPLTFQPATFAIAANSAEPQLTPHAGGAVVSWLEQSARGVTLKFAERTTAGGWSAVNTVASGKDWFVSWADVPSVTRLAGGTLVAQWLKNVDPTIEAYDLMLASSHDNGGTWTAPFSPHHDRTRTQHGFASLFPWTDPGGQPGFGVVWLDGRDQELNTKDPEGGSMALYYARFDRAGKQLAEAAANERVCECCSTSVAVTSEGPIAAFRDRSDKEVRDIHVSRFEKGAWTAPVVVHADNWTIESCPVNGPSVSAAGMTVAVAWFAVKGDEGHAYTAFSRDGGRTFGAPVQLDDGTSLGHVGVELLDDGSAAASWIEFADQRSHLRVRRVEASGERSAPVEVAGSGAGHVSGHPRITRVGSDLVLAWTESKGEGDDGEGQQVRVATAAIPAR